MHHTGKASPGQWVCDPSLETDESPLLAHCVGSLRRTDSVAIEGIADIRRSLAARRSDANDPNRTWPGSAARLCYAMLCFVQSTGGRQ
jgi:hypothetical protein